MTDPASVLPSLLGHGLVVYRADAGHEATFRFTFPLASPLALAAE